MHKRQTDHTALLTTLLALSLIVVFWLLPSVAVYNNTKKIETLTLADKWTKRTSQYGEKYLIGTDKGVYSVTDNLWAGKFRASDTYASLTEGQTVCAETSGYRLGIVSSYRNINRIVKNGAC